MTRSNWILTSVVVVGLCPSPLWADKGKSAVKPAAHSITTAGPTAVYHAPFGYFQTHWRAFPTVSETLPEPGPKAPVTRTPLLRKEPTDKAGVAVGRDSTAAEKTSKPAPRPVEQTTATQTSTPAPKQPSRPERGFATMRSPTDVPIATSQAAPIAAPPIPPPPAVKTPTIDSGIRPVRGDDDVLRPAWPTLPPPKK